MFRSKKKYSNFFYFFNIKTQIYVCPIEYRLSGICRSNQSTFRYQRPFVHVGIWIQIGDLLADSSDSLCGQFVVGRNLLLGYIPWDGLNFEDAVIANENLTTKEIFTSAHIEEWVTSSMKTQFGIEIFVPFSIQLVNCMTIEQHKSWIDLSFVSKRILLWSMIEKRTRQIFPKESVLSWIGKKKGFLFIGGMSFLAKRNILNTGSKKIVVKSLNLLEKMRTWNLRKRHDLICNLFGSKILLNALWQIEKENRCEFHLYKKNIETFFEKAYISKYLKYRILISGCFHTTETLTRIRERGDRFFPGYKDLDYRGLVNIGSWVKPGQILALRIRPLPSPRLTPYEWLLFDILDQKPPTIQNISFRTPDGISGRVLNVETFPFDETTSSKLLPIGKKWKELLNPILFKNKEANLAFWSVVNSIEYNTKSVVVSSKNIIYKTSFFSNVVLTNSIRIFIRNRNGYRANDFLFLSRKILTYPKFFYFFEKSKTKTGFSNNKLNLNLFFFFFNSHLIKEQKHIDFIQSHQIFTRIRIMISIYRRIRIGDKIAGRHGNKGILTRLIPNSNIPYLPNGISLDFVLNPLGIPSRINVGQIYEAVIGLAGFFLGEEFTLPSFDECNQAKIASRSLVFEKLCEARVKTRQSWLFNLRQPGKFPIFDGRTSEIIDQDVAVGESYILKLVHIVDNKIHVRDTGSYSLVTQQPLRGRARNGGQRVGEIERWALEGFGTSYILQEILTVKSDDLIGRGPRLLKAIFQNRPLLVRLPDTFRVLACELQALCLDIILFHKNNVLISFLNSMINDLFKTKNLDWEPSLSKDTFRKSSREIMDSTKIIFRSQTKQNIEASRKKNNWKLPVRELKIRVVSPRQIRTLCLRQSSEGFLIGRVWNINTVSYKDLKPIPGGLFCESTFGSLKRGRCVCIRIQWRSYPKLPRKLRRIELVSCPYCLTYRIYPIFHYKSSLINICLNKKFLSSFSKHFILKFQDIFFLKAEFILSKVKSFFKFFVETKENQIILCRCKRISTNIYWFFSVVCICKFCITSTGIPFYGIINNQWLLKIKKTSTYQTKDYSTFVDIVNLDYQPGFCECGRTNTEIVWDKSTFCGYCGVEVSIEFLPRRYCLGYLPLSVPIAHFWYYYYEPQPISRLIGFSRHLFLILLRCERIVAEEIFLVLKLKNQIYFSTDFQPIEHLSNSSFTTTTNLTSIEISLNNLIRGYKRKKFFAKISTKKENLFYSGILRQCNVVIPKVEMCTFPWYCLYRDIFIFPFSGRYGIENLEDMNNLLISSPNKKDCSFNLYQIFYNIGSQYFLENVFFIKKLGTRYQTRWLFREPTRTGGELILNRLQIFNYKDWCIQAKRRLKILKEDIEIFKKRTSLSKNENAKARRLFRIRNQILVRFRIMIEMQWVYLKPYWLILQCLPILPPDLRPILSLGDGKIIASDINSLYQRVIERNNRVAQRRRLVRFHGRYSTRDLRYHERLFQEALECLFENSTRGKKREKDSKQRVYKSLAKVLKGKRGRFRNNLLGKRVDYSGRSVIISGPDINLYQCGLPQEIAIILFQPFLIRFLVGQTRNGKKIQTRFQARQYLKKRSHNTIWIRITEILWGFPVLLNRAPTLHRFGFQAFQSKLIYGRAVHLHPLVCSGFNADFDGDQIAIHVPLSPRSRSEAWHLIVPGSHFFSPATGELTFFPSQDIVLGIYYLTTKDFISSFSNFIVRYINFDIKFVPFKRKKKAFLLFSKDDEIFQILEKNRLKFHQFIWLYDQKSRFFDYEQDLSLFERRLDINGKEEKYSLWHWNVNKPKIRIFQTTVGRFIFSFSLTQLQKK